VEKCRLGGGGGGPSDLRSQASHRLTPERRAL